MRIASFHGLAILVENDYTTGSLGKLLNIVAHANYAAVDGWAVGSGEELALMVRSRTKVDESVLVAILAEDGSQTVGQRVPPLQLTAPESSEVAVDLTVVILEYAGVDRE